jgi:hypothetical protein
VILLALISVAARAGQKDKFHFTGNPIVDLFGEQAFAMKDLNFKDTGSTHGGFPGEPKRKNPWVGGILSVLVPGAGELYSQSYVKAGIFAGIEAASWIGYFHFHDRGDNQTTAYENYANQHFNAGQYLRWTYQNAGALGGVDPADYYPGGDTIYDSPPYSRMNWTELNALESAIENTPSSGYTRLLPRWGQQQYYELIGTYSQFGAGWSDANLGPWNGTTNSVSPFEQAYYADLIQQANHSYSIANAYFKVMIINHVISALDGYWSATRFNHSMHASISLQLTPSQYGLEPSPEAHLSFDL